MKNVANPKEYQPIHDSAEALLKEWQRLMTPHRVPSAREFFRSVLGRISAFAAVKSGHFLSSERQKEESQTTHPEGRQEAVLPTFEEWTEKNFLRLWEISETTKKQLQAQQQEINELRQRLAK